MKIGLLHDSILPPKTYGGIERIVVSLAREYRRLGHQVVLISRPETRFEDFENIPIPSNLADLSKILPRDLDFLHSHQPLPEKPSVAFLVTIHGNGQPQERYFANTNFLSQSHARNHNAKFFIYNGVDQTRYPFVSQKQDYFVFLARTTWRVKNLTTAIAWANDLGVNLEIMGGSGLSRGKIRYHGLLGEAEKLKLLSQAKALIYPTNWDEPCAAAPLEALACGTPVISSVNGCMPELIRPGAGVICESYQDLLSAPSKLSGIQTADCRRSIEEYFSLQRMAQDYLKLIEKIQSDGDLDHQPKFNFKSDSVKFLFKPTLWNQLKFQLRGKI